MRQALNNLQSTWSGFGFVNADNVFKVSIQSFISSQLTLSGDLPHTQVCDEPHPLLIKQMIGYCVEGKIDEAYQVLKSLWDKGYSPQDIITNVFRVCKNHQMPEYLKLEFIKVNSESYSLPVFGLPPHTLLTQP